MYENTLDNENKICIDVQFNNTADRTTFQSADIAHNFTFIFLSQQLPIHIEAGDKIPHYPTGRIGKWQQVEIRKNIKKQPKSINMIK